MDPARFLLEIRKKKPSAGYLFLGNEMYTRDGCRRALLESALSAEERAGGLSEYDLGETPLAHVIEEARTLSLFTPARLIVAYNAEAVLGRRSDSETEEESAPPAAAILEEYFHDPTPGVVLLFEALRLDWDDRDEKRKLERLAAFFAAVPVKIELRRFSEREALEGAQELASQHRLRLPGELLAEMVDALGHDMSRIAAEIVKLGLYAGPEGEISARELALLVPEARTTGLYELTDALAAHDRSRALEILDVLTSLGMYLPLQITLLASLLRMALAVKESGARGESEVSRLFARLGLPAWPGRVRQVLETARRFTLPQLEQALQLLFESDVDLRRDRPSDRIVMEKLVWALTR